MMYEERPRYISYMLRLWQVGDQGQPIWRASLENPHTGEQHGFANVDALFEFVRQEIGIADETREGGENGEHRGL